jgi:hypothetical protein
MKWKVWDMPGREPICALRASAPRTSASASTGRLSPNTSDGTAEQLLARKQAMADRGVQQGVSVTQLAHQAQIAGWVTPSARDWKDTPGMSLTGTNPDGTLRARIDQLPRQAAIAGWQTPKVADATGGQTSRGGKRKHELLLGGEARAAAAGMMSSGSLAPTEKPGPLNPALSRWLMGFPAAWDECAPTGTPSSRNSQPNS